MAKNRKKLKGCKNFYEYEFRCKCGCGILFVDPRLIRKLELMRKKLGPITVRSGCRCPKWNRICGGKRRSAHITTKKRPCQAADLGLRGGGSLMRLNIVEAALSTGIKIRRIGPHKTFVHVDVAKHLPEGLWVY